MPPEYVRTGRPAASSNSKRSRRTRAPPPRLGAWELEQLADHLEVLEPGEVFVDRRELAGEPDDGTHLLRLADYVVTHHLGAAGIRRQQGREDADRGRLPGAVRAQDGQHGSLLDVEVDRPKRVRRPERLDQAF